MPVLSYIAFPVNGKKTELFNTLSALEFCEVIPSDNKDVLVLVTDTPDEEHEKKLQERLKKINHLQSLSMTFGHSGD
jgi:nitrate reductase NapAB chaperone NapD